MAITFPLFGRPKEIPKQVGMVPQAPILNPSSDNSVEFGRYRADAIAREIEQRRNDKQPQHPEHDFIVGEAMAYAWLQFGRSWTLNDVKAFQARIFGR